MIKTTAIANILWLIEAAFRGGLLLCTLITLLVVRVNGVGSADGSRRGARVHVRGRQSACIVVVIVVSGWGSVGIGCSTIVVLFDGSGGGGGCPVGCAGLIVVGWVVCSVAGWDAWVDVVISCVLASTVIINATAINTTSKAIIIIIIVAIVVVVANVAETVAQTAEPAAIIITIIVWAARIVAVVVAVAIIVVVAVRCAGFQCAWCATNTCGVGCLASCIATIRIAIVVSARYDVGICSIQADVGVPAQADSTLVQMSWICYTCPNWGRLCGWWYLRFALPLQFCALAWSVQLRAAGIQW